MVVEWKSKENSIIVGNFSYTAVCCADKNKRKRPSVISGVVPLWKGVGSGRVRESSSVLRKSVGKKRGQTSSDLLGLERAVRSCSTRRRVVEGGDGDDFGGMIFRGGGGGERIWD